MDMPNCNAPFADRVGKTGTDPRGVRFLVLDMRNILGAPPMYEVPGAWVVVLPGSRSRVGGSPAPGVILNYSWIELPILWDPESIGGARDGLPHAAAHALTELTQLTQWRARPDLVADLTWVR